MPPSWPRRSRERERLSCLVHLGYRQLDESGCGESLSNASTAREPAYERKLCVYEGGSACRAVAQAQLLLIVRVAPGAPGASARAVDQRQQPRGAQPGGRRSASAADVARRCERGGRKAAKTQAWYASRRRRSLCNPERRVDEEIALSAPYDSLGMESRQASALTIPTMPQSDRLERR